MSRIAFTSERMGQGRREEEGEERGGRRKERKGGRRERGATVAQRPSIKRRLTIRACSLQTLELPGDTMTKRLLPFNK